MIGQIAATFLIVAGIASLIRATVPAAVSAAVGAFMLFLNADVFNAASALASSLTYLPSLTVTTTPDTGSSTADILALIAVGLISGAATGFVFALWRVASSAFHPTRLIRFYLLILAAVGVLLLWLVDRGTLPGSTWWAGPLWSAGAFAAALLTFHRRRWSTPKFAVATVKDNRQQAGERRV